MLNYTAVIHSRDHEEVGMAPKQHHSNTNPNNEGAVLVRP